MANEVQTEADGLLLREWRGETLHTVYQLDDGRIMKRYWIRPGVTRFKRPWRREHAALVRLASARFGNSYGYTERPHNHGWEAALTRDPVDGVWPITLQSDDAADVAEVLASVHRSAVLVADMPPRGVCRHADGKLVFNEFGSAALYPVITLQFCFRAGKEVRRLGRTLLGPDPAISGALKRAYLARDDVKGVRRLALRAGLRITG